MYRVGLPGWKLAAKLGVPVRLRVNIRQDLEANVYVAESPDLDGLIVEGHTLDDIKDEALSAARILIELELCTKQEHSHVRAHTDFIMHSAVPA
ncbi:MAG: type II toxin-antitoxin system HicB family antitoxin [Burkholderiaceae bacterium]